MHCEGSLIRICSHPQLWNGRSDPVLHIELRRWADLMLVAPLDANTLAKLANGICDNLLVSNRRVLSPPSVRLSDLSFMETLVLLQHREHSDLHILLPLHTLLSLFLWYGPLLLLNQFFFPSPTYSPFHSSAPSLSPIIS